jgi:hypothetical protein
MAGVPADRYHGILGLGLSQSQFVGRHGQPPLTASSSANVKSRSSFGLLAVPAVSPRVLLIILSDMARSSFSTCGGSTLGNG